MQELELALQEADSKCTAALSELDGHIHRTDADIKAATLEKEELEERVCWLQEVCDRHYSMNDIGAIPKPVQKACIATHAPGGSEA